MVDPGLGCMTPNDRFKQASSPDAIAVVHNTITEAVTRVSGVLSVCRYDPLKPSSQAAPRNERTAPSLYPRDHDLKPSGEHRINHRLDLGSTTESIDFIVKGERDE